MDNLSWLEITGRNTPWIHAIVTSSLGQLTYQVKTNEGGVWRRNVNQKRKISENVTIAVTDTFNPNTLVSNEMHSATSTNNTFSPGIPTIPKCLYNQNCVVNNVILYKI
jgi:hypothetical protein